MKTVNVLLGNALGKVIGLLREITLAYFLGATGAADAFRVSLIATLLPTHFFMGDVLDGAFVPLYSRYLRSNPASGRRLLGLTSGYLLFIASGLALLTWVAGTAVVRIFGPGLAPATVELAGKMLRWMGLGIPIYCFASLYSLYGICHGRFGPLALRSTFQNVAIVLIIPVAAWIGDPQWLGLGFPLAFLAYLSFTWYALGDLRRRDAAAARSTVPEGGELRALVNAATPLLVTMALGQILATIDRAAASFAGVGAVASLEYARTFVETPQVLVGYAVGTVALSRFSVVRKEAVSAQAAALIFPLITGVLGLMLMIAVSAPDLVTLAYRRGRFDANAVALVTEGLRGLAVGGAFMMAVYIMMRIISAQMRNRENIVPMAVAALVEGIAVAALVPRLGLFGVGLAVSLMQLCLFTLLAARLGLLRDLGRRIPGWGLGMLGVALVAATMLRPSAAAALPLRLALSILVVGVSWGIGNLLSGPTRADLFVLARHVEQSYRHMRASTGVRRGGTQEAGSEKKRSDADGAA